MTDYTERKSWIMFNRIDSIIERYSNEGQAGLALLFSTWEDCAKSLLATFPARSWPVMTGEEIASASDSAVQAILQIFAQSAEIVHPPHRTPVFGIDEQHWRDVSKKIMELHKQVQS